MAEKTNEVWLAELSADHAGYISAVTELREIIRRGLHKSIGSRPGVDENLVEDLSQDAVMKVLSSLGSFRGDSRFTTWAIAIAIRVGLTELRRARWRDVSLDAMLEDAGQPVAESRGTTSAVAVERQEIVDLMKRVIAEDLTERQRQVLTAELSGIPQVAIAERLGIKMNAIYKLAYDARQKLKSKMLSAGITEDEVRETFGITS